MKNSARKQKKCTYLLLIVLLGTISILPTNAKSEKESTAQTATAEKITVCLGQSPDIMDPLSSQSVAATQFIMRNVFDMLVWVGPEGNPEGTIATWEALDGGKCYEFKIRKGIKFTSGDPLTARDVEFSWNRLYDKCRQFKGDLLFFDHLEVVDDYTIRFYLTQPNIKFILQNVLGFAFVGSKSYYDRVGEEEFVRKPVGTGPYKFVEYKEGQYIDLVRNEDYWGEKPQVKHVRFVWSNEAATSAAMLEAGEIDFLWNVAWENVPGLEESGFKTVKTPSRTIAVQFAMINPDTPWADVRVRQAINYAIDKEAIRNKLFYGIPTEIGWLAPGEPGYNPTFKPAYPYDLGKAKKLLAEAGYPDGFDLPLYKGGLFGPNVGAVVDYLVLALRDVGIKCNVKFIEGPQILEIFRKAHKDTTMEIVAATGMPLTDSADPIIGLAQMFISSQPMSNYHTPELDALIDKGLGTIDDTRRGELIKQAYKIIDHDLPAIPIMQAAIVHVMKPNMDWEPRGSKGLAGLPIADIKVK